MEPIIAGVTTTKISEIKGFFLGKNSGNKGLKE